VARRASDQVDVGEVVGHCPGWAPVRSAGVLRGGVRVVETLVVHEDAMNAYGVEVGRQRFTFIHGAAVFAVSLAQGEDRSTGAEDLLPKVGKGLPASSRVYRDDGNWCRPRVSRTLQDYAQFRGLFLETRDRMGAPFRGRVYCGYRTWRPTASR